MQGFESRVKNGIAMCFISHVFCKIGAGFFCLAASQEEPYTTSMCRGPEPLGYLGCRIRTPNPIYHKPLQHNIFPLNPKPINPKPIYP